MKAQQFSAALLLLSVVLFSCKKDTAPRIKNTGLAGTTGILALSFVQDLEATSAQSVSNLGFYSGDFDGDGRTDVFQPYNNGGLLAVKVHRLVEFNQTQLIVDQKNNMDDAGAVSIGFVAADYDGDGKTDLIQCWNWQNNMAINVLKSTGSGFVKTFETVTNQTASTIRLLPVDVNGDGKMDIAQLSQDGSKLKIIVYLSTGSGYTVGSSVTQNQGYGSIGAGFFTADMDGDGKTEIVQAWNQDVPGQPGRLGLLFYKANSNNIYSNSGSTTIGQGSGNTGLIPLDYNKDGKTDFAQTWDNNGETNIILYKSTGATYEQAATTFTTGKGAGALAWVPVKFAGQNDGILQIWNNNGAVSFFRYTAIE